jgi:hypothetical protein
MYICIFPVNVAILPVTKLFDIMRLTDYADKRMLQRHVSRDSMATSCALCFPNRVDSSIFLSAPFRNFTTYYEGRVQSYETARLVSNIAVT